MDMDAFFASCEQLTRPTLRGKPVLVGGVDGRGVVAGASYEARAFGAHSAMPMWHAKALIGYTAVAVTPRKAVYSAVSHHVFEIIGETAGVYEQLSIDEAFMEPSELQGATATDVTAWCEELRARIRSEVGIACSIGAGAGKQYAKIGSGLAKPDGVFLVPAAQQAEILGPLPVRSLWGIGPVAETKLKQLGVDTIADFAAMSAKEVEITLGATVGLALWRLANGTDDRPVAPRAIAKQISSEHTYRHDVTTVEEVDAAVERAAREAHTRLLADGRGARTITVKEKMADFHIESRSTTLPYATDEFDTLFAAAMRLVQYPTQVGPIRLIGVSFSGLEYARQGVLFPDLDLDPPRVAQTTNTEDKATAPTPLREPLFTSTRFRPTQDVHHTEFGHGWVQGAGEGVVTVRFETASTGPGRARSFPEDDPDLTPADPLDSLA